MEAIYRCGEIPRIQFDRLNKACPRLPAAVHRRARHRRCRRLRAGPPAGYPRGGRPTRPHQALSGPGCRDPPPGGKPAAVVCATPREWLLRTSEEHRPKWDGTPLCCHHWRVARLRANAMASVRAAVIFEPYLFRPAGATSPFSPGVTGSGWGRACPILLPSP